jgi:hypothetical protein
MTKVCCAYTDCKNNRKTNEGYFCSLKAINIIYVALHDDTDGRCVCDMYECRKGYCASKEMRQYD